MRQLRCARLTPGNVPHDWLFADGRVSAVCHHGGEPSQAANEEAELIDRSRNNCHWSAQWTAHNCRSILWRPEVSVRVNDEKC